jgi:hypothetical protein
VTVIRWSSVVCIAALSAALACNIPPRVDSTPTAGTVTPGGSLQPVPQEPSPSATPSATASATDTAEASMAVDAAPPPPPQQLVDYCTRTGAEPCFRLHACTNAGVRMRSTLFDVAARCLRKAKTGGTTCIPGEAGDCAVLALRHGDARGRADAIAACRSLAAGCPSQPDGGVPRATCERLLSGLTPRGVQDVTRCLEADECSTLGWGLENGIGYCVLFGD